MRCAYTPCRELATRGAVYRRLIANRCTSVRRRRFLHRTGARPRTYLNIRDPCRRGDRRSGTPSTPVRFLAGMRVCETFAASNITFTVPADQIRVMAISLRGTRCSGRFPSPRTLADRDSDEALVVARENWFPCHQGVGGGGGKVMRVALTGRFARSWQLARVKPLGVRQR